MICLVYLIRTLSSTYHRSTDQEGSPWIDPRCAFFAICQGGPGQMNKWVIEYNASTDELPIPHDKLPHSRHSKLDSQTDGDNSRRRVGEVQRIDDEIVRKPCEWTKKQQPRLLLPTIRRHLPSYTPYERETSQGVKKISRGIIPS